LLATLTHQFTLFEKWGLPIWKDEEGDYVHEGRWQLMINGESYKVIVAEAAKNALGMDNIMERVFIVEPLMDGDKISGAVGFSVAKINSMYSKLKPFISVLAVLYTYSNLVHPAKVLAVLGIHLGTPVLQHISQSKPVQK
jgi:succinate dehydrogenase/fumarate reductase flavoprotein subunit